MTIYLRGETMCVLCGDILDQLHWTDQRRFADDEAYVEVGGLSRRNQAIERRRRMHLMTDVLDFYLLNVSDWQGTHYVIANRKGSSVLARNLEEVWSTADELAGHTIDPFDPVLLEFLRARCS